MDGEIYFNMFREPHPLYGKSEYLLKRWTKHTIYALSGSYKRTDKMSWHRTDYISASMYSTCSIFLYDYVVVSDRWFFENVYTASVVDATPAATWSYVAGGISSSVFSHYPNTWKNSPNARTNDYLLRPNPEATTWLGRDIYGPSAAYTSPTQSYNDLMHVPIFRATDGSYYEIVRGYPRNHYFHKRGYLCLDRYMSYGRIGRLITSSSYSRGRQTVNTTVGPTGLGDGSTPVQSTQVSNVEIVKSDNVIYH